MGVGSSRSWTRGEILGIFKMSDFQDGRLLGFPPFVFFGAFHAVGIPLDFA